MLIQSIIERDGGTHVTIGEGDDAREYHFKPDSKHGGAHVCEVDNKRDIQRFLSITEGYRIPGDDKKQSKPAPAQTQDTGDNNVMSDDEVLAFAKFEMGIENPEDKNELADYALETYSLEVRKNKKPVNIIRDIIEYAEFVKQAEGGDE